MSTLATKYRSDIDKLWTEFWTGGITNPLTVIEQISYLMFLRMLDVEETRKEKVAARTKKEPNRTFGPKQQHLRWSSFRHESPTEMLKTIRDGVFPHLRELGKGTTFGEHIKDAQLMVTKASLLASAVEKVSELPITEGDAKGDLYEYLLSKLTTAGINGQFRTPRHVIRFMVELLEPKPTDVVADPACGTAGFLVGIMDYLKDEHTSAKGIIKTPDGASIRSGDLLEPHLDHIRNHMFHGFDFDATMLRLASMNLMLHGVDNPAIHDQDSLSSSFKDKYPALAEGRFDVILANPPFKGSLDEGDVDPSLTSKVKTKKTELLFVALILRMLKNRAGRSATIVPDGVLFGSSSAHKQLRKTLIDDHQLEAVISLPSGVFKPYAGVSTAIIVFNKGGKTDHVFFYDVQQDGFSLDDKRTPAGDAVGAMGPTAENDLYAALERYKRKSAKKDTDRTAQHFMVPVSDIVAKDYDLSINRYKETKHEAIVYDPPKVIIARLRKLEAEINQDLSELERML